MCGICGILELDGSRPDRAARVERMSRAMAHRGPDDQGFYQDERVTFGFRRLAVIDLETGQQPIVLEDRRAVIVLNGEIYNFRELRREIGDRQRFRSKGDVEVVLRIYAEQGIECLRRLHGMFALAIWDRSCGKLFLARDRFGIKPLFICREPGRLAFASELGTLLAGGFPQTREIDRLELRHYLSQRHPSPGGSILRAVRAVPPGCVLEVGAAGEQLHRYWTPPVGAGAPGAQEAGEELQRCLQAAVRRQLVADVPLGVFLSGGVDSGTLVALVRDADAGPVRTFSVGFVGPGAVSELPEARALSRALGTEHHQLVMDPGQVASDLDAILAGLDGPLGDATAIPTWYMSMLARQRVTVALSGEGADELFGGYARQLYDVWTDRIGRVGAALVPLALQLAGRPVSARLRQRLGMPAGLWRQLDWSRVFTAEEIDGLAAEPLADESELAALHAELAGRWAGLAGHEPVNARLELDRELFLPGDLLPKVDRMSMAHSLEVRVPYLDDEVVDLVVALPGRLKLRGLRGKWLLRRVASRVLPREVARRRKQGFEVPIGAWMRGPLRDPLTDYLSPETVRRRGLFRPERVTDLLRQHLDGDADHGQRLYLLLALEVWQQQVLDRATGWSP
jgi:asparagine synthase (glutamine-hydrolysing)